MAYGVFLEVQAKGMKKEGLLDSPVYRSLIDLEKSNGQTLFEVLFEQSGNDIDVFLEALKSSARVTLLEIDTAESKKRIHVTKNLQSTYSTKMLVLCSFVLGEKFSSSTQEVDGFINKVASKILDEAVKSRKNALKLSGCAFALGKFFTRGMLSQHEAESMGRKLPESIEEVHDQIMKDCDFCQRLHAAMQIRFQEKYAKKSGI